MYGILPGYSNGVEASAVISAAPAAINDSVTVIYCDYNFPLWEYNVNFTSATSGANRHSHAERRFIHRLRQRLPLPEEFRPAT